MPKTRAKIVCWGELVWDVFQLDAETPLELLGGSATAIAAHLAARGADVRLLSAVGDDRRGDIARKTLKARGINCDGLQTRSGAGTACVAIELDRDGEPSYRPRQRLDFFGVDFEASLTTAVRDAGALVFSLFMQHQVVDLDVLERVIARQRPALVGCDLNLRSNVTASVLARVAELADIVKLNGAENERACAVLSERDASAWLLGRGRVRLVALTLAAAGAELRTRTTCVRAKGKPALAVQDSVGAGDAFMSELLLATLEGRAPATTLERAMSAAEAQCGQRGALPPLAESI